MKRLSLLALLIAAAAPQAPVPLASEPHHRQIFDNSYARIFRAEVAAHDKTLLHEHDRDFFFVAISDEKFTNSVPGKPDTIVALSDGNMRFFRGGFAHVAANMLDTRFRNMTVEFARPQGNVRNLCEEIVAREPLNCLAGGTKKYAPAGYWVIPDFETDEARVSTVRIKPKGTFPAKSEGDQLVFTLANSTVDVSVEGQPRKTLHEMETAWIPRGSSRSIHNAAKTESRVLVIEFKDSTPKR
jgi:quercetin dioxygenase-like cupin family protein